MNNWDQSEQCGGCKFWADVGDVDGDQGACHRFPGQSVMVLHFEWCGEFQPGFAPALAAREKFRRDRESTREAPQGGKS